jgi:carbonic anhydrase
MAPARKLAVVACMDARLDVHAILGLRPGDAHVIRNAGALATEDVIRSVGLSQTQLDTETVLVIGHTRCAVLKENAEAGVREAVSTLAASPDIPRKDVRGFIYDVETGRLSEV